MDSASQIQGYADKVRKTSVERYGVAHVSQSEEFIKRRQASYLASHGVSNPAQRHLSPATYSQLHNKEWLYEAHCLQGRSSMEIAKELGVTYRTVRLNFKKYGIPHRHFYTSGAEKEIVVWIKDSLGIEDVIVNDRKIIYPKEIDIVVPGSGIAIEHNGIYWHSFGKTETTEEKRMHIDKLEACREKGLMLLQINEDEWFSETKRGIWKSIIASKLGKVFRIGARTCRLESVDTAEKTKFLNANHLQGAHASERNYGLYYQDDLVALMTFAKPRYSSKHQWEMIRFCSKTMLSVTGGAARLLRAFIQDQSPKSIITYADRRYSSGKMYEALGFQWSHDTEPNYSYFDPKTTSRSSRILYQKHKLADRIKHFDPKLSERENMFANGFRRMWDCGNRVFTMTL